MKRDMDLIRDLMLEIETFEGNAYRREYWPMKPKFENVGRHLLDYHLLLLLDAGFIRATRLSDPASTPTDVIHGLTWQGCEFLETIRDEEVWRKTKAGATTVGSFGLQTVLEIGKGILAKKAEDWLTGQFS